MKGYPDATIVKETTVGCTAVAAKNTSPRSAITAEAEVAATKVTCPKEHISQTTLVTLPSVGTGPAAEGPISV